METLTIEKVTKIRDFAYKKMMQFASEGNHYKTITPGYLAFMKKLGLRHAPYVTFTHEWRHWNNVLTKLRDAGNNGKN